MSALTQKCGLCSKQGKLKRTECCKNWICDDEDKYVPFSYVDNSCHRNHRKYTFCSAHFNEKHKESDWRKCKECIGTTGTPMDTWYATNEYNFVKMENPPQYPPIICKTCQQKINLAEDGYAKSGNDYCCFRCYHAKNKRKNPRPRAEPPAPVPEMQAPAESQAQQQIEEEPQPQAPAQSETQAQVQPPSGQNQVSSQPHAGLQEHGQERAERLPGSQAQLQAESQPKPDEMQQEQLPAQPQRNTASFQPEPQTQAEETKHESAEKVTKKTPQGENEKNKQPRRKSQRVITVSQIEETINDEIQSKFGRRNSVVEHNEEKESSSQLPSTSNRSTGKKPKGKTWVYYGTTAENEGTASSGRRGRQKNSTRNVSNIRATSVSELRGNSQIEGWNRKYIILTPNSLSLSRDENRDTHNQRKYGKTKAVPTQAATKIMNKKVKKNEDEQEKKNAKTIRMVFEENTGQTTSTRRERSQSGTGRRDDSKTSVESVKSNGKGNRKKVQGTKKKT